MLSRSLCLCLALGLALALAAPGKDKGHAHDHAHDHEHDHLDRCKGIEMDAVAVNEDGVPYFFKGDHLFKGFSGHSELSNESFAEMDDDHHLGHVDAAFRMHFEDGHDHDHMYFFLDDKVFSYYKHKLEAGFPKNISEVFPGIPDHLDAAVSCPKPDCQEHTVIFFLEHNVYFYHVESKVVDKKEFTTMPNCTAAFRFMEHYYCFHGHQFSRFDPKDGEVHGKYPKEARDYFMRCANFSNATNEVERERCTHTHLDAFTSDHEGNLHAFRGFHFIERDADNDTLRVDDIEHAFEEVHSEVDAAFTYEGHIYMIKDDKVWNYKDAVPHVLADGYPKTVKEELGLEGPVDAAFVCEDHHIVHVIKGGLMYDVDLNVHPRVPSEGIPISLFKHIDAAMCDQHGIKVIVGNHFYRFDSPKILAAAKALPDQHKVAQELLGCDH